jgi:cytochrome c oxidase cbb3-type subunit 3
MRIRRVFIGVVLGGVLANSLAAQAPTGGRGGSGAGRGGPARAGFPQKTRQLAPADVLTRGRNVYETNCASCHASDLRGGPPKGHSLLHSMTALNDQHGELISAELLKHAAPITLVGGDPVAVAEYIHSVLATTGGQGSPPPRPDSQQINILVGDSTAGESYFAAHCVSCHSVTGDLKGIASKYDDARALQNAWVAGTAAGGRGGGRGGGGGAGNAVTVTMPDGKKFEGRLVRQDDFLVVLTLADGTRKSIARDGDIPKVVVTDPNADHKKMALALDDPHNKNMHDVTAYLATLK